MGKCKFNNDWKKQFPWLVEDPNDVERAKCTLCKCSFSISNKGVGGVKQHANGTEHGKAEKAKASTVAIERFIPSKFCI